MRRLENSLSSGNPKPLIRRTPHIIVTLLVGIVLILNSCEKKATEAELVAAFKDFDRFLRKDDFRYDSMKFFLKEINKSFSNADNQELSYDKWKTSVTYRWNTDSSLVLVVSNKQLPHGFRREVFLHGGDSVMFVHRFSTEPLGMGNTQNYSFLESIYYLEDVGTVKYLARISYREHHLADTLSFQRKPFADLSDKTSHYYSLEVQNSRDILRLN